MDASEGSVKIHVPKGVFYNSEMELCRDIFSLAVGAIGGKIDIADAMCASGIRGMRYKKENPNAGKLALVDTSALAIACARKNARANKIDCKCAKSEAGAFLRGNGFDFVELDPFGSPQPFLHDAARSFSKIRRGYLSATATDMAVLCGAHHAACLKNYASVPLDNEFCHENAVRILAATVARAFSPFNLAATPVFSFSHRHYIKILFSISFGSEGAVEGMKKIGFVSYCPSCLWRGASRFPSSSPCPHCSHALLIAGPLCIGRLWDTGFVSKMLALNAARRYKNCDRIEKLLRTIEEESRIHTYGYYDLHRLAKKSKKAIKAMDEAIFSLRSRGFAASRTHFCPTAIRTDAPHKEVLFMVVK